MPVKGSSAFHHLIFVFIQFLPYSCEGQQIPSLVSFVICLGSDQAGILLRIPLQFTETSSKILKEGNYWGNWINDLSSQFSHIHHWPFTERMVLINAVHYRVLTWKQNGTLCFLAGWSIFYLPKHTEVLNRTNYVAAAKQNKKQKCSGWAEHVNVTVIGHTLAIRPWAAVFSLSFLLSYCFSLPVILFFFNTNRAGLHWFWKRRKQIRRACFCWGLPAWLGTHWAPCPGAPPRCQPPQPGVGMAVGALRGCFMSLLKKNNK